jgi:DnaJ-class molecular chaperone
MSSLKQTLEIHVRPLMYHSKTERFVGDAFDCPACHGRGLFCHAIGHDEYENIVCTHCDGIGRIKPTITVQWNPDNGSNDPGQSI